TDNSLGFLISTVNASTILHIYLMPHPDAVYIASYHCIEPYTTLLPHDYIAYNSSIGCNKTTFGDGRCNIIYGKYYRHECKLKKQNPKSRKQNPKANSQ